MKNLKLLSPADQNLQRLIERRRDADDMSPLDEVTREALTECIVVHDARDERIDLLGKHDAFLLELARGALIRAEVREYDRIMNERLDKKLAAESGRADSVSAVRGAIHRMRIGGLVDSASTEEKAKREHTDDISSRWRKRSN